MLRKTLPSTLWISVLSAVVATGCGSGPQQEDTLTAAFLYLAQPGDLGWTYEHEEGRLALEDELGDEVSTFTITDVPDGEDSHDSVKQAIEDAVERDADVIFTTSFGYMDPTYEMAEEYPGIIFEHCSGYKTRDNMATYFGRMYQPRYLSGLVAGSMTETDTIGYVAAFAIPEVIRGINAFTLGVRDANSDATVKVEWTETWYNPSKERAAAETLLDAGADIITQHQDTPEPQQAARQEDKLSIGYNSDMSRFVGDSVLTGPVWNWGEYYVETVKAVLDDTWSTHEYWGDLKSGVVGLAPLSSEVPQAVATKVEQARDAVLGGEDVFCGPIANISGDEQVANGDCMSDPDIWSMDWFVEGVDVTLPPE